jgi:hypothetical protein
MRPQHARSPDVRVFGTHSPDYSICARNDKANAGMMHFSVAGEPVGHENGICAPEAWTGGTKRLSFAKT